MYNMLQDQDVTAAYKSLTVTEELYKDSSKAYLEQNNISHFRCFILHFYETFEL